MMINCANPAAQFRSHQKEIEDAVLSVLRGNRFILGQQVEALESEFADYIGTTASIGVANGTDALELSLRAMDIGHGDEVITVSHTAVATVAAIEAAGAIPVLVDVEQDSCTLLAKQLHEVLSPRTRAVIAVHLYGQPADLDAIIEFCSSNNLELIEDVSQAHGAYWNGRRLGSIGRIGCFSCYPTKNLGAIGDAGLLTTNDEVLARRIREVREYGWRDRYVSDRVGRNSRLDELQAAILRVKLRHLDSDNTKRQAIASLYKSHIGNPYIKHPTTRPSSDHVYHLYVVQTDYQNALLSHLKDYRINAGVHYPLPVHLQPAYKNRLLQSGDLCVTELLSQQVVSLPMYPELSDGEIQHVIIALNQFDPLSRR